MTRPEYYFNVIIRTVLVLSLVVTAPVLIFWTLIFDNFLKE